MEVHSVFALTMGSDRFYIKSYHVNTMGRVYIKSYLVNILDPIGFT